MHLVRKIKRLVSRSHKTLSLTRIRRGLTTIPDSTSAVNFDMYSVVSHGLCSESSHVDLNVSVAGQNQDGSESRSEAEPDQQIIQVEVPEWENLESSELEPQIEPEQQETGVNVSESLGQDGSKSRSEAEPQQLIQIRDVKVSESQDLRSSELRSQTEAEQQKTQVFESQSQDGSEITSDTQREQKKSQAKLLECEAMDAITDVECKECRTDIAIERIVACVLSTNISTATIPEAEVQEITIHQPIDLNASELGQLAVLAQRNPPYEIPVTFLKKYSENVIAYRETYKSPSASNSQKGNSEFSINEFFSTEVKANESKEESVILNYEDAQGVLISEDTKAAVSGKNTEDLVNEEDSDPVLNGDDSQAISNGEEARVHIDAQDGSIKDIDELISSDAPVENSAAGKLSTYLLGIDTGESESATVIEDKSQSTTNLQFLTDDIDEYCTKLNFSDDLSRSDSLPNIARKKQPVIISKKASKLKSISNRSFTKRPIIGNKYILSGQKIQQIKTKIETAIAEHKVYSMHGNYESARIALNSRGWVEKLEAPIFSKPPTERFTKKPKNVTVEELSNIIPKRTLGETEHDYVNKCEKKIRSKMLENYLVDLYWGITREGQNDKSPYVSVKRNRLPTAPFTSKQGLSYAIQHMHPFFTKGAAEVLFPRCYNISAREQLDAFVKDFRITACVSLLKFLIETASRGHRSLEKPNGRVPTTAVRFAIDRCDEYVLHKTQPSFMPVFIPNNDWEVFLRHQRAIANDNGTFAINLRMPLIFLYIDAKRVVANMRKYLPQIDIDGTLNIWILKPSNDCRGRGIKLANTMNGLRDIIAKPNAYGKKVRYVVQKYIERPLLIQRTKFDIRQWFLVVGTCPLVVWMYKVCYLRFSSQPYSLHNYHESVHLTNNAVQKKYKNALRRSDFLPIENMWDSDTFQMYLKDHDQPTAWAKIIYPGMKMCIVGALLSSQSQLGNRVNSFELFGADFMLDEQFNPWLIEINSSPDMSPSTGVTRQMCPKVLEDVVKVAIDSRSQSQNLRTRGNFECIYVQRSSTGANNIATSPLSALSLQSINGKVVANEKTTEIISGGQNLLDSDNDSILSDVSESIINGLLYSILDNLTISSNLNDEDNASENDQNEIMSNNEDHADENLQEVEKLDRDLHYNASAEPDSHPDNNNNTADSDNEHATQLYIVDTVNHTELNALKQNKSNSTNMVKFIDEKSLKIKKIISATTRLIKSSKVVNKIVKEVDSTPITSEIQSSDTAPLVEPLCTGADSFSNLEGLLYKQVEDTTNHTNDPKETETIVNSPLIPTRSVESSKSAKDIIILKPMKNENNSECAIKKKSDSLFKCGKSTRTPETRSVSSQGKLSILETKKNTQTKTAGDKSSSDVEKTLVKCGASKAREEKRIQQKHGSIKVENQINKKQVIKSVTNLKPNTKVVHAEEIVNDVTNKIITMRKDSKRERKVLLDYKFSKEAAATGCAVKILNSKNATKSSCNTDPKYTKANRVVASLSKNEKLQKTEKSNITNLSHKNKQSEYPVKRMIDEKPPIQSDRLEERNAKAKLLVTKGNQKTKQSGNLSTTKTINPNASKVPTKTTDLSSVNKLYTVASFAVSHTGKSKTMNQATQVPAGKQLDQSQLISKKVEAIHNYISSNGTGNNESRRQIKTERKDSKPVQNVSLSNIQRKIQHARAANGKGKAVTGSVGFLKKLEMVNHKGQVTFPKETEKPPVIKSSIIIRKKNNNTENSNTKSLLGGIVRNVTRDDMVERANKILAKIGKANPNEAVGASEYKYWSDQADRSLEAKLKNKNKIVLSQFSSVHPNFDISFTPSQTKKYASLKRKISNLINYCNKCDHVPKSTTNLYHKREVVNQSIILPHSVKERTLPDVKYDRRVNRVIKKFDSDENEDKIAQGYMILKEKSSNVTFNLSPACPNITVNQSETDKVKYSNKRSVKMKGGVGKNLNNNLYKVELDDLNIKVEYCKNTKS